MNATARQQLAINTSAKSCPQCDADVPTGMGGYPCAPCSRENQARFRITHAHLFVDLRRP